MPLLFTENAANSSLVPRESAGQLLEPGRRLRDYTRVAPARLLPRVPTRHRPLRTLNLANVNARRYSGVRHGPGSRRCLGAGDLEGARPERRRTADKVGLGSIRRPVIGLALGGGAARGFAHIGIMRTLLAHGIVPDVVVGTSIGAVVGGSYAAAISTRWKNGRAACSRATSSAISTSASTAPA